MRTTIGRAVVCLCVMAVATRSTHATNGMKVIGVGPVQRSMAGSGSALPLDAATAMTNPAVVEHHVTAGLGIKLKQNTILNIAVMVAPKVSLATANSAQFIDRAVTEMSQYSLDVGLALRL
ncbi:MAG: hypothetical protein JW993_02450 [Sedimentisphaerales bacterium]|nr:hypothetical protein [Sedimentisphaerales bacterium]